MTMTVQMAPVNTANDQKVHFQIKKNGSWKTIASNSIHKQARTTHFRVNQWDDTQDTPYRVRFSLKDEDNKVKDHYWEGAIRKDPKDKTLSVAGFTGNTDRVFPNTQLVKNVLIQNPDLLFFSGDQIYEDTGGYHMRRRDDDDTILNYLGKWYLFGWAFRDLLKDRPSVIIPDDHDVYQGNVWGNGGNAITVSEHDRGGYAMPVDFVNAVHRTQVSHHPDAYDPTPIKQNISVYYGDMIYGRVSFAIIADRMFKSGPKGTVNTGRGRPDWLLDPKIDPKSLDTKGLALLGDRQLKFLDHWASNWRGADMKCVLSQTIFCSLANYCGGGRTFVVADLDSNGWPQTGRNKALDSIRRGFGFMCAGDQHLSSIVQHGIDDYGDAGYSFCVPSICVGYPRSWLPDKEGRPVTNRIDGLANTGNYREGFGNPITVHAAGNPSGMFWSINKSDSGLEKKSHDKASGHGMVYFNKKDGTITMECYRLLFDARKAEAQDQFPGWPKTIKFQDNYGRQAKAWLPTLEFETVSNPVVQIIDEASNEVVYTLRVNAKSFSPKVFNPGKYTIKVGGQGKNKETELNGVEAVAEANSKKVSF